MAEIIKIKELNHTKILKNYASWIYCSGCSQTIGYLCYVTYSKIDMEYLCQCKNHGSIRIEKEVTGASIQSMDQPVIIKNRLCCPRDESPLITILNHKLDRYSCKITCKKCNHEYLVTN